MSLNIDEEVKCKAYIELIKELEQQIEDKVEEKEKLEIEYLKKRFLYDIKENMDDSAKEEYRKEEDIIISKIKEEESSIFNLENTKEDLQNRFDRKFGKKQ